MNIMTSEQPMSKFDHFNGVSSLINFISLQALAYEACDHTRMPLHMPKTLETCKKSTPCLITHLKELLIKKSTPCLIKSSLRCVTDHTSKATFFQISYEKTMRIY